MAVVQKRRGLKFKFNLVFQSLCTAFYELSGFFFLDLSCLSVFKSIFCLFQTEAYRYLRLSYNHQFPSTPYSNKSNIVSQFFNCLASHTHSQLHSPINGNTKYTYVCQKKIIYIYTTRLNPRRLNQVPDNDFYTAGAVLTRTVLTRRVSSYGLPAALSGYGVNASGIAEIVVIFRNDS